MSPAIAEVVIAGPAGDRTVPLERFYTGPGETVLPGVEALVFVQRAYDRGDGSHNVTGGSGQTIDYRRYEPGGGVFVLDTMGKEVLARIFSPAGAQTLDDGDALFQRRAVTRDWSLSESAWTLVQGERARTFHVRHWLYSGQEMRRMMLDAGFTRVDLYGNLDGEPYDVEARRLVAVARKR